MAKKDDLAAAKAERDKALKAVQAEEKKAGNTNEYSQSYYDARNRYNKAQSKLNELESAGKPKAKPKARDPYTEVPGGQSSVAAARSVEERKKMMEAKRTRKTTLVERAALAREAKKRKAEERQAQTQNMSDSVKTYSNVDEFINSIPLGKARELYLALDKIFG